MTYEEEADLLRATLKPAADQRDARLIAGEPYDAVVADYRRVADPAVERFMAAMDREIESWRPR